MENDDKLNEKIEQRKKKNVKSEESKKGLLNDSI